MTLKITAAAIDTMFQADLEIDGLRLGRRYTLERIAKGQTVLLRQWIADATNVQWADVTMPFNADVTYRVSGNGQTAVSKPVRLPFSPSAVIDTPLWDTAEPDTSWPVLRAANKPGLGYMKLPVSGYRADFGYRSNVMQVLGSQIPVVSTDVVVMKQGTVVFLTPSQEDRERLLAILRETSLIHLRAPCVNGLGDLYARVLDIEENIPAPGRPLLREWQIEYQQVPKPSGYGLFDWESSVRWRDVKKMGTWADVKARGTWRDVRNGDESMGSQPVYAAGQW